MSDQPKALQLADALDNGQSFYGESSLWFDKKLAEAAGEAADELRRLAAVEAERDALLEALKQILFHAKRRIPDVSIEVIAQAAIDAARGET